MDLLPLNLRLAGKFSEIVAVQVEAARVVKLTLVVSVEGGLLHQNTAFVKDVQDLSGIQHVEVNVLLFAVEGEVSVTEVLVALAGWLRGVPDINLELTV